jgi:hypothetical protein
MPPAALYHDRSTIRQAPTMAGERLAEDLVFNIFSCFTGAFLCMMFGMSSLDRDASDKTGCRMNVLRCRKETARNPPLQFLAMVVCGILTISSNMLLEHLVGCGYERACRAAAVNAAVFLFVNKLLALLYFLELMHAIRACRDCTMEVCKWYRRWGHDGLWVGLTAFLVLASLSVAVHTAISHGTGELDPLKGCIISEKMPRVLHTLAWDIGCTVFILFGFLGISCCTMSHYPGLNDVTRWQYKLRSFLVRILPNKAVCAPDEPIGSDHPIVCPSYLVPINGRTAGISERSSLIAGLTLALTLIPTTLNLALMLGFSLTEQSWMMLLLCNFEGATICFSNHR